MTSNTNIDDFQDPLENYDTKTPEDPLEQALVEQEVEAIRHEPFSIIAPETTIKEAIEKLSGLHIACLLVEDKGKLVGVLSERDILQNVAIEFEQIQDEPVSSVMTDEPIYVYETDAAVKALSVMAICGYRHVPIVDLNDNLTGIVSPQRVVEFLKTNSSKQ